MRMGIADTTFARIDMASPAIAILKKEAPQAIIERYTVPGFKDLPVAAKKLLEEYHCDLVLAFGYAGGAPLDEQCAMEANISLMQVELMTNKHILKVFIFQSEEADQKKLQAIAVDRSEKHAQNALALLKGKEALTPQAGKGLRQGQQHAGPL